MATLPREHASMNETHAVAQLGVFRAPLIYLA
jgi:hypothetical protein